MSLESQLICWFEVVFIFIYVAMYILAMVQNADEEEKTLIVNRFSQALFVGVSFGVWRWSFAAGLFAFGVMFAWRKY